MTDDRTEARTRGFAREPVKTDEVETTRPRLDDVERRVAREQRAAAWERELKRRAARHTPPSR
jgi:hypothetical protein